MSLEAVGEHLHRRVVGGEERHARTYGVDAGLLRGEDQVVELALQRRERAVDGQRAGDVGGVEVVALHAHVEQHQLAGLDGAGVVDPVQRGRVRAARADRVVADVVAHRAGAAEEGALDPALAELQHPVPLAHGVLEAEGGDVARLLQLADLPLVLDQPQLVGDAAEVLVGGHVAALAVVVEGRQVLDVADLDAERVGDLLRGRASSGPQLAVLPVAEELVGVALRARAGVEHGLAVVDDQHGVGGLVAGEVRVGGVGPEPVVGVVGAHLVGARRQHQPLAGERLGQLGAPRGRRVGDRVARHLERAVAPALAHERGVGGGHGGVVRLGLRLVAAGGRQGSRQGSRQSARSRGHSTPRAAPRGGREARPLGCGEAGRAPLLR